MVSFGRLKPIIMIGGGGHASVLADILLRQNRKIEAIISPDDLSERSVFKGITQLKEDVDVKHYSVDEVELVNGIGMMPHSDLRETINRHYLALGYQFATVIADSAEVSSFAELKSGVQILNQALIQTGAVIGAHSIVNSKALIEHDCQVGQYNHIAPGAVICGQVRTAKGVFIGAGSVVTQGIALPAGTILGAGTVLTKPVPEKAVITGNRTFESRLF